MSKALIDIYAESWDFRTFEVKKINKRLFLCTLEDRKPIYTPPDFYRPHIRSRQELIAVANNINGGTPYIEAILEFETTLSDRYWAKKKTLEFLS